MENTNYLNMPSKIKWEEEEQRVSFDITTNFFGTLIAEWKKDWYQIMRDWQCHR
jgi:hypothetical protein